MPCTHASSPAHDVIIAGAGPVGLFLACELALAGCTVLVLDKAAQPDAPLKRLPFGLRGLSAPGIEALARRGLLDQLAMPGQSAPAFAQGAPSSRPGGHFAGIPFLHAHVDEAQWPYRLPGSPPASMMVEMAALEALLARRARELGVEIRRGHAVSGFDQDAGGVTVHADGLALRAGWLVGCDGSRSAVRKAGGFGFAGTEPEFTGYTARVELADPGQLPLGRQLMPGGVLVQSQPGLLAIQDVDGGAFHATGLPVTRAHLEQVLRRVTGTDVRIDALHLASTWTDRARQATRYCEGRVLLAGDAAHIHAPLGGQGLNLGLGDAVNLGWKLAATVKGTAPANLLDSYQQERHPVGARVLDWSRAQVALMRPDPGARALRATVSELIGTRDGATYIAGRVWGLATRYPLDGDHPLVGRSLPDFRCADGVQAGVALHDGLGLLLDFTGDWTLASAAQGYRGRVHHVAGQPCADLGVGAVLARPDGIVAWACDAAGAAACDGLDHALAHWFGAAGRATSVPSATARR